jgi:TusA-related sulfurtransferase
MVAEIVDLTAVKCPLTLLRVVEVLNPMQPGEEIDILVKGAEPVRDMSENLKREGHSIFIVTVEGNDVHRIRIRRGAVED